MDAAYGGGAILAERGKVLLKGIELADSLTVDPHKWFFQPYEIGCVLVRNRQHLRDTFQVSAEYLKILEHDFDQINFYDYGVQLTRGFRALKLWMSLKVFGLESFRAAVETGLANAEHVQSLLEKDTCWEIMTPARLGIVTFRYVRKGAELEELNALNKRIATKLIYDGYAMVVPTYIGETLVLRLCPINPRTTREDLEGTIERLKGFASESH